MPIATDLKGKYSASINGLTRMLEITAQDTAAQTISGNWYSSINTVLTTFAVSGIYSPAASNTSNGLFFTVSGIGQVNDTSHQAAIWRAVETVTGYAEVSGPGTVDRLFITIAWAEDKPNNAKESSAWTPCYLDRQ